MWARLMLSLAASLARISQLQASKQVFGLATEADYGLNSFGLLATFDPVSCCWKMSQLSLLPEAWRSLVRLPKSGMTRNGRLYELPMLAHRTGANAGSVWPTVTTGSSSNRNKRYAQGGLPLTAAIKWASPVASDAVAGAIIGANDTYYETNGLPRKVNQNGTDGGVGLGRLVKLWPTPIQAMADKGTSDPRLLPAQARGGSKEQLNPDWTEGLMGFPAGYTDIEESAEQTIMRNAGLPDQTKRSMPMSRPVSQGEKIIELTA